MPEAAAVTRRALGIRFAAERAAVYEADDGRVSGLGECRTCR